MQAALVAKSRPVAIEVHALLRELDPVRFRKRRVSSIQHRCERIRADLVELSFVDLSRPTDLPERLAALEHVLASHPPANDTRRRSWMALRSQLEPAYLELADSLRAHEVEVPDLRPTNRARTLLHLGSAITGITTTILLPEVILVVASIFFGASVLLEVTRRASPRFNDVVFGALSKFAHPHERNRINSASWYAAALFVLALFFEPRVCVVALAVLGVGDPVAGFVGRRWGKHKLLYGRSVEGSSAFVVTAFAIALLVLRAFYAPTTTLGLAAAIAFAAALAGAVAEALSRKVDDNLSVPLAAACAAAAVVAVLG